MKEQSGFCDNPHPFDILVKDKEKEKTVRPEAGVKTDLEIAQSNCDACKS